LSFYGPPFELLEHLFAGHLAGHFTVGQRHGSAAACAYAAGRHQADFAVSGGLPCDNAKALCRRVYELVGALDIAGCAGADGEGVLTGRLK
jgi:hypothetical protein